MFNWATEQLEKLSTVVAPPSSDPASRFVYCVQKYDEAGAQSCLAEMDPLHTVVQQSKGTMPIHLVCGQGMVNLIRQIMAIPGASMEVTDAAGNTPLHHACMSMDPTNGPHVVRVLITEYNASVVAKNWQGQTPYDVATVNGIRQYILPLQLQQETQQAIDNGGVGLPPGIDMGGLKISNPAMAPPPMGGMGNGGVPPTPPSNAANAAPSMLATPSPNMPSVQGIPQAEPMSTKPPKAPQSANAVVPPTSGNRPYERSTSTASAPNSGNSATQRDYARSGASSAAMLSKAKFRPDGFHSSSSDVSLQKKYGHSNHGMPAAAVPPPPSSGNTEPPTGAGSGTNPFAAGSSAFGSANRYGRASGRYPVYSATQANVIAQPSSAGGGYSSGGMQQQQAAIPSYTMFQPGSQTQTQQHHQATPQQPFSSEPQQAPTTPFMSPPPYQQQQQQQPQQAIYTQNEQNSSYQQVATSQQTQPANAYQQPPTQTGLQHAPLQAPVEQTGVEQPSSSPTQPPMPSHTPMSHTASSISGSSAEQLFAAPSPSATDDKMPVPTVSVADPASRSVTQDSARSSVSSAQELFSGNAGGGMTDVSTHQHSNEGSGTDTTGILAAPAGPSANTAVPVSQADTTSALATAYIVGANGARETQAASTGSNIAVSANVTDIAGDSAAESTDDALDDVPLDEVPLAPSVAAFTSGTNQATTVPSQTAAFSSIGLPPPPFSSRQ